MKTDMSLVPFLDRIVPLGGDAEFLMKHTGMSGDAAACVLGGKRGLSSVELHHVAAALDVSVHWLLTGERDPFEVQFAGYGCTYPFADAEEEEMMEDARH